MKPTHAAKWLLTMTAGLQAWNFESMENDPESAAERRRRSTNTAPPSYRLATIRDTAAALRRL